MTHQIRKNAPEGATHYEIFRGQLWYFRLNDDDTVDVDKGGGNWIHEWWIDIEYLESRHVHAFESEAANYWFAAAIVTVLFVVLMVKHYGSGG